MKKHTGFTLIELMITLAIVGVLLLVGLPSLKTTMQGNQVVAATNELLSALHVARSEAIKLNSRVSICPTAGDGTTDCDGSDWSNGWVVFVDGADPAGNLEHSGAACTAPNTDCLLRIHDAFTDDLLSIRAIDSGDNAISSFTFTSRGLPKTTTGGSQSGNFSVCSLDSSGNVVDSRAVVLSLSGRVRISDNSAVITCPAP